MWDFDLIYHLVGLSIFGFNLSMIPNYKKTLASVEWFCLYQNMNRKPDKSRIDYKALRLWIIYSLLSSLWLFVGVLFKNNYLFLFLLILNIVSNYLITKNQSSVKIELSYIKTIVFNLIFFVILVSYFASL